MGSPAGSATTPHPVPWEPAIEPIPGALCSPLAERKGRGGGKSALEAGAARPNRCCTAITSLRRYEEFSCSPTFSRGEVPRVMFRLL
jgi:hypothetical protein